MATVVVERSFPEPAVLEDVQALEDAVAWCLEQHGVTFLRTYFARDRTRMVCLYEAPDAEAVRHTQKTGGLPFDRIWAARAFDAVPRGEARGEHVIVERTFPMVLGPPEMEAFVYGDPGCADLYRVQLVRSMLGPDGQRVVCYYRGPDAESVRRVSETEGIPFDRAWTATLHEPG